VGAARRAVRRTRRPSCRHPLVSAVCDQVFRGAQIAQFKVRPRCSRTCWWWPASQCDVPALVGSAAASGPPVGARLHLADPTATDRAARRQRRQHQPRPGRAAVRRRRGDQRLRDDSDHTRATRRLPVPEPELPQHDPQPGLLRRRVPPAPPVDRTDRSGQTTVPEGGPVRRRGRAGRLPRRRGRIPRRPASR
jgi:hypothetical protein